MPRFNPPVTGGSGGVGTVTSINVAVPAPLAATGGPVSAAGTVTLAWATGQTQNRVLASPNGASGAVALRALVADDMGAVNPAALTGAGTVPLGALSGITTAQLDAAAGILSAQIAALATSKLTGTLAANQIASVNPSALTGSGTVPLAGVSPTRQMIALTARGLLCENFPYGLCAPANQQAMSQQAMFMGNLAVRHGETVTGLRLAVTVAATSTAPTGIYVGLYKANGTRVAVSGNLAADAMWTSIGYADAAFTAAYVSDADQALYAMFLMDGAFAGVALALAAGDVSTALVGTAPAGAAGGIALVRQQDSQATPPSVATFADSGTPWWWVALY